MRLSEFDEEAEILQLLAEAEIEELTKEQSDLDNVALTLHREFLKADTLLRNMQNK